MSELLATWMRLGLLTVSLAGMCPLTTYAQNPLATPAANNEIEARLSRARWALNQLPGKLDQARFERLDRGLTDAERAWREVKSLALANNVACPDVVFDQKGQTKGIANPGVVVVPAGATVSELLLPFVALASIVYVIHQYHVAPEARDRDKSEHALSDLAIKLEAVTSEATSMLEDTRTVATTLTPLQMKKGCNCFCMGKVQPRPQPDKHHGNPNVGFVQFDADCRAECTFRAFPSYQCK